MQRREAPCAQPVPGSPHSGRARDPLAAGGACTCPPGHPPAGEAGSLGTEGLACGAQPLRCRGGEEGGRAGPQGGGRPGPGAGRGTRWPGWGWGPLRQPGSRETRPERGSAGARGPGSRCAPSSQGSVQLSWLGWWLLVALVGWRVRENNLDGFPRVGTSGRRQLVRPDLAKVHLQGDRRLGFLSCPPKDSCYPPLAAT